ncbi:ATPase [Sagittula salina]|uniref:ATP synthase subunit b n=1 Tax=Sagittula salina TaxID=2820268 RepID=A0A940MUE8_9RHOB|nr:ATPase [Sagittula salina]MBP0485071.1 ATPase [Sagittula salina]
MTFDFTTFALQLVNVLVLLAILRHFLFRPVADIIARRKAQTEAALDAAAQARTEAETATAQAHAQAAEQTAARAAILEAATREAGSRRAELLDKAHEEAAQIVAEGRAARSHEREAEDERALTRLRDLSVAVARQALAAQPPDMQGYLDRLAATLAAMPEGDRKALLSGPLTLVSAARLPDALLRQAQAALAPYGATATPATDPALIAGIELRSPSGVLRNSLAHDLDLLAKALHDDRA